MNTIYRIARASLAALGLSAILLEIFTLTGEGSFHVGNFFSFFTILSNLAAVILLAYFAFKKQPTTRDQAFRTATTLYMIMTGVIFSILLSNLAGVRLTAVPWDNTVLHYIMPIAVALDWLIQPAKPTIFKLKNVLLWLSIPLLYVLYSLIRGAFVHWYPYPFLNPAHSSYASVAITVCALAGGVVLVTFGMFAYSKLRHKG